MVQQWIPCAERLPEPRQSVLVLIEGDAVPHYAWLKHAAGVKEEPYFVCPGRASLKPRGLMIDAPVMTHWLPLGDIPLAGTAKPADFGLDGTLASGGYRLWVELKKGEG